jgi:hypothetical protein
MKSDCLKLSRIVWKDVFFNVHAAVNTRLLLFSLPVGGFLGGVDKKRKDLTRIRGVCLNPDFAFVGEITPGGPRESVLLCLLEHPRAPLRLTVKTLRGLSQLQSPYNLVLGLLIEYFHPSTSRTATFHESCTWTLSPRTGHRSRIEKIIILEREYNLRRYLYFFLIHTVHFKFSLLVWQFTGSSSQ